MARHRPTNPQIILIYEKSWGQESNFKTEFIFFLSKLVGKIKQGVNGSAGWYSSETNGSVQKVYISEEVFVWKKATVATFRG